MRFPRPRTEAIEINLTPLIDVVFLLLIFFMVSTTFTRETRLSLTLPEASAEQATAVATYIEVTVSAGGEYSVNGRALGRVKAAELARAIAENKVDKGMPFVIAADADASHQSVVTAMDVAGKLGYMNISIATQEASE